MTTGPTVDGSASMGYKREEQGLPTLYCSFLEFSKAFNQEEDQDAVQLALLGRLYNYLGWNMADLARFQGRELTAKEQEEQLKLTEWVAESLSRSRKDGIAPLDNRYYVIPLDSNQPVIVSAEPFLVRATRVNSRAANMFFFPEDIAVAQAEQEIGIDSLTGLPLTKRGDLQDLRDAVCIIEHGKYLVRSVMQHADPRLWRVPGITE